MSGSIKGPPYEIKLSDQDHEYFRKLVGFEIQVNEKYDPDVFMNDI